VAGRGDPSAHILSDGGGGRQRGPSAHISSDGGGGGRQRGPSTRILGDGGGGGRQSLRGPICSCFEPQSTEGGEVAGSELEWRGEDE